MKFIDMFAGIGGFHFGMEQAGHECVGWVEIDKYARKSYENIHNVKGVWTKDDITKIKPEELPKSDCWCFGFPCQDISIAGKTKGFTEGKRSSLFFRVMELNSQLKEEDKPKYLFIENVKNLLSINRGLDFAKLLIEMDQRGYDAEWTVLDSSEVVPQHRERLFIVGHLRGKSTTKVFPITNSTEKSEKIEIKQVANYLIGSNRSWDNPQDGRIYDVNGISPTLNSSGKIPKITVDDKIKNLISYSDKGIKVKQAVKRGYDIAHKGDSINLAYANSTNRRGRVGKQQTNTLTASANAMSVVLDSYEIRKLTPKECWRLQGFPDKAFDIAKSIGISDTQLYKQAGNAVTVPVIKLIAQKMK